MSQTRSRFLNIGLFGRPQTDGLGSALNSLIQTIEPLGAKVWVETATAAHVGAIHAQKIQQADLNELSRNIDLAIILGGDGTLLGIARQIAPADIPILGVNQGRLGFMTDLDISQMADELPAILSGDYVEEQRSMLQVSVMRRMAPTGPRTAVFDAPALNDAVISRGAISRMVELDVFVDDHFLQSLRADGLIVSTPTGSTAYALSALGSILHPRLPGITLVPVAPQALSSRPIVLPDDTEVAVVVKEGAGTTLHCDMQALTSLEDGDKILIRPGAHKVRLLHPKSYDYFVTLRRKLHWSATPVLSGRPDPLPPSEHH